MSYPGWDVDPLIPPDEPQPAPRRRSGCLGWVVVAVVALTIAGAAPQRPQDARNAGTRVVVAAALVAVPQGAPDTVTPFAAVRPVPALPGASLQMGPPSPVGGAPQAEGRAGPLAPIGGYATWYDAVCQRCAAAGPLLREAFGDWRGKAIRVTSGRHSVIVALRDWCACGERAGLPTVLDLSRDAFTQLAPIGAGVIRVEIELVALPATDVAP